jgi:hypothetical protein
MRKLAKFRQYQLGMIQFELEHPRCAVWAGMGTGKTLSTLTALDALYMGGYQRPALVLAPLRVAQ